ncbi:MAG: hypothetical protein HKO65_02475 [Gemmatimonadetes bacterium]|nr:hypothetical protein [Gemmatimonadota bacterium]
MSGGPLSLLWMLTAIAAGGLGFDVASRDPGPSDVHVAAPNGDFGRGPVRPLPFFYDLHTFRAEGGLTTVVAAFAVEAGELETERVGDNDRYRFNVTLLLADTVLHSVTNRHDSVFVQLPRRMRDEHVLYTHIEVEAPPSRAIRQTVFMTDPTESGIGQMYWEYIRIPDYSGTELMLSDVALGQPDAQIGWERRGATLALLPTRQLPSRAFDVYYEIYNLPAGNPYTTEITVERVADSSGKPTADREPVSLRFAGESTAAADGTLPELRRMGTSFAKGGYRMTVTIEDLTTGKTASRSRTFEVQTSGRGATMVPAQPVAPLIR